jgi:hypothetical protein
MTKKTFFESVCRVVALLCFIVTAVQAQLTPLEIKYKVWGLHALRQYPFERRADDIVNRLIAGDSSDFFAPKPYVFQKTSLNLVVNMRWTDEWTYPKPPIEAVLYKNILKYYGSWLKYAHPVENHPNDRNLTLFSTQTYANHSRRKTNLTGNIFDFIDADNLSYLLNEWTGNADLSNNGNEILTLPVKNPLAGNAMKTYRYYLSGTTEIDGTPAYEIAFFSKKRVDNTFEGFLYVSANDFSLLKAEFTLNAYARRKGVSEMLFTHTPSKKEHLFYLGNDEKAALLLNRTEIRADRILDSLPLTASEQEMPALLEEAAHTRAYRNLQKAGLLLITDKIGIFDDRLETAPVSSTIYYSEPEGLRLRIGGNTTWKLNRRISAGGYVAYGFGDKRLKYRGDIRYARNRNDQLRFTYVYDLNLPGYDLLNDERGHFLHSLSHSGTQNMLLQKIGRVNYEKKILRDFSAELTAKYMMERAPSFSFLQALGAGGMQEIPSVTTTECGFSLRYAPGEKFIELRGKRLIFQDAAFDLSLNYRRGVEGIFNSRHNYNITAFSACRKIEFPLHAGHVGIRLSGGKVWDRAPFPILFIPGGNQGYIFETENYNLMDYNEFVTDRYLAGQLDFTFNWSPVKIIRPKSKIRINIGLRSLYGPLSDNNNPQIHPELFVFNNGTKALGTAPYTEINAGLDNILKIFRIDYVYRLHDERRQSVLFSVSFGI